MRFQERVAEATLKMPTALREIFSAELAAGNEVAELESGSVAGSVVVRMHYAFRRLPGQLRMGIVYTEQTETDPMVFECRTDDGLWSIRFEKFKPIALPSLPEGPDPRFAHVAAMKIVQAREAEAMGRKAALEHASVDKNEAAKPVCEPLSKGSHQFTDHFRIEADFRGEMIRYSEGDSFTQMMWTWTNDYSVYPDTMEPWNNTNGSSTPISESERATVLERVLKYALDEQNVKMKVR